MSGFQGYGIISIAPYESGATFGARKFRDSGNNSGFSTSFSENKEELRDFRTSAGGTDSAVSRLESMTGQLDARHFTPENFAMAVWGTTEVLNATPIADEPHVLHAGAFVPAERMIDMTVAPVVKKGATVVDTDDYTVSAGGIKFNSTITTADVADGDDITFSYTPVACTSIEALVTGAPLVSIFFDGGNAVTGKRAIGRYYKCKLGVAQNIGLITESGFGTLGITFTVLKDDTVPGTGTSKFFKLDQEN